MKLLKIVFIFSFIQLFNFSVVGQEALVDTALAEQYFAKGDEFYDSMDLKLSNDYYQKAADIFKNIALIDDDKKMWERYVQYSCRRVHDGVQSWG